jgi:hypothetical protein
VIADVVVRIAGAGAGPLFPEQQHGAAGFCAVFPQQDFSGCSMSGTSFQILLKHYPRVNGIYVGIS